MTNSVIFAGPVPVLPHVGSVLRPGLRVALALLQRLAVLRLSLYAPTLTASSPAVRPMKRVLGGELMAVLAVGPRSVIVQSGDFAGAMPPIAHLLGKLTAPFGRGHFLVHNIPLLVPSAGSAMPGTSGANARVLGIVFMPLRTVRLAGVVVGPVPSLVAIISRWRIPTQILQPIISRVAIGVAALHSRGAWSNKGFQHQAVDGAGAPANHDLAVPLANLDVFQNAPIQAKSAVAATNIPIQATHSPRAAHLVGADKIGDGLPNLHHVNDYTVARNWTVSCK